MEPFGKTLPRAMMPVFRFVDKQPLFPHSNILHIQTPRKRRSRRGGNDTRVQVNINNSPFNQMEILEVRTMMNDHLRRDSLETN